MKNKKKSYGIENEMNLKLIIGLTRTASFHTRMTQSTLSEYNLTIAQFGVLEVLYHLGDLKICEIIEKTLSTSGNMTVVINNLERDGYIQRYTSAEDKRVSMISLTEKGKILIAEVFPIHVARVYKHFENLNYDEKEQLLLLLKKLNGK